MCATPILKRGLDHVLQHLQMNGLSSGIHDSVRNQPIIARDENPPLRCLSNRQLLDDRIGAFPAGRVNHQSVTLAAADRASLPSLPVKDNDRGVVGNGLITGNPIHQLGASKLGKARSVLPKPLQAKDGIVPIDD